MAVYPVFSTTDKASAIPAIAGTALSADFCTQAFPSSNNKRLVANFRTVLPTTGATAAEAFIDGVPNFRYRLAQNSTALLKVLATYVSTVGASNTAFELTVAAMNVGGTVTLLGTPLSVKYPGASTANIATTVVGEALAMTCSGNAGDVNGQWDVRLVSVSEVTDIG